MPRKGEESEEKRGSWKERAEEKEKRRTKGRRGKWGGRDEKLAKGCERGERA